MKLEMDKKTDADENESRDDVDFDVMLDRLEEGALQIAQEKEKTELTEFEKKLAKMDSLVLQTQVLKKSKEEVAERSHKQRSS